MDTIEQLKRAVRSQARFKKKSARIVFSSVDSTSLIRFEFWCRRPISNYHTKNINTRSPSLVPHWSCQVEKIPETAADISPYATSHFQQTMPVGGSRGTLGRWTNNHVFQSLAALSANLFIFPQWQGWDIKDDRLPEAELRPNRGAEAEGKNNFSFNIDRIMLNANSDRRPSRSLDLSQIIWLDGLQEPEFGWRAGGGGTLGRWGSSFFNEVDSTLRFEICFFKIFINLLFLGSGAVAVAAEVHLLLKIWESRK